LEIYMAPIDMFKKSIRESLYGQVSEKIDPKVNELAGALIAAGPQKTGEAISKMDPGVFAEFCSKIDADGILKVTQQFATTAPAAAPAATPDAGAAPAAPGAAAPATPAAPPAEPKLAGL
jgi:hypothetical protein